MLASQALKILWSVKKYVLQVGLHTEEDFPIGAGGEIFLLPSNLSAEPFGHLAPAVGSGKEQSAVEGV